MWEEVESSGSKVQVNGIQHYLGVFEREEDAAKVYLEFIQNSLNEKDFEDNELCRKGHKPSCANGNFSMFCCIPRSLTQHPSQAIEDTFQSISLPELTTTTASNKNSGPINWKYTASKMEDSSCYDSLLNPIACRQTKVIDLSSEMRGNTISNSIANNLYYNNVLDQQVSASEEWKNFWVRRVLIGKALHLSASLYQLRYEVYNCSSCRSYQEYQREPDYWSRPTRRRIGQCLTEPLADSIAEGKLLHEYLEECLLQLLHTSK